MLSLLTRQKRMTGGLYFGPPAWHPAAIEDETDKLPDCPIPTFPDSTESLITLLTKINLAATSSITPSLIDQLHLVGHRDIKSLILNLLPTQPEFALPSAIARIAFPEIAAAIRLLQSILKPRRTLIVVDRHDLRTHHHLRRSRKTSGKSRIDRINFDIKTLRNQYPQAHPTILLRVLFGKRLPVGRLPIRHNHLVLDPVTVWALGRHLTTGQPFNRRPIQLFTTGPKDSAARLVMAPLADPPESIDALCRRYGITPESPGATQTILNGMLAGQLIDPLHEKLTAQTESISIRPRPTEEPPSPCFSCGWCVDVCPTSLNPVSLLNLAEQAQRGASGFESPAVAAELRSNHARESLHCIGCGLCSYVCPTRLPLTQQILKLRNHLDTKQNP